MSEQAKGEGVGRSSVFRDCHIIVREGSTLPLFEEQSNGMFVVNLDGYVIAPKELYRPDRDALLKEAAEALSDAAAWFREYEKIHINKRPPDNDKARRNRVRAEHLEAVLARLRAQEGGGG